MKYVLLSLIGSFLILCFSLLLPNYLYYLKDFVVFENELLLKGSVLVIGILSARENFLQRQTLRSTWLNEYVNNSYHSVKTWFILGNSSCSIPPEYRISQYECEKWNIDISGNGKKLFTVRKEISKRSQPDKIVFQGYSFKVNHPIVINKLGVLSDVISLKDKIKVAIVDIQSKEVVVETEILSDTSSVYDGFIYSPIKTMLFPKDYEGLVIFEGYMQHSNCSNLIWSNGGGTITYKRLYPTSNNLDSVKFFNGACSAVSMEFFIDEPDLLRNKADNEYNITENWKSYISEIEKKIMIEQEDHSDLLILDTMDTYRNLPKKLLMFYKWLQINKKFQFVLKSDDDTILNIELLLKELKENSKFDPHSTWLWSRFRKDWPVNYVGKWADYEYKASLYPQFPCGAAYVMSRHMVFWLADNSEILHSYQGEDVSIGIWSSAINAELIEEENFECSSTCTTKSYNRGQLNIDQIQQAWSIYKNCHNLCAC